MCLGRSVVRWQSAEAGEGKRCSGERGLGALPGREDEFNAGLEKALIYAEATGCKTLHAMAGIVPSGATTEQMFETFVENLTKATDLCADAGVTIVLEALNNQDAPGALATSK